MRGIVVLCAPLFDIHLKKTIVLYLIDEAVL